MASEPGQPPPPNTLLRRADQALLAAIVLAALVAMTGYWLTQIVVARRVVDIDRAKSAPVVFQVDVNTAPWTEFLQLPEIGESLAREIVAYRKSHGPFANVSDLRQVKGIGKKKFEGIKPFLRPIGVSAK